MGRQKKKSGGGRKIGRSKDKCNRYRLAGRREENKRRKQEKHRKKMEKKRRRNEKKESSRV